MTKYHIAGMLGRINVWKIAELEIGEKKCGEWIDFGHCNTINELEFARVKFGKPQMIRQIHQTFLLPNIPTI